MSKIYTLDLETELFSTLDDYPPPVVLSTYGEGEHYLSLNIEQEMKKHFLAGDTLVWHNAAFDMAVLYKHFPKLRALIFEAYDKGRIRCTLIRESLLHLSVVGHLRNSKSLAACVMRYFEVDISESKTDENAWRLKYGELIGVPLEEWPEAASEYALSDTKHGSDIYYRQEALANTDGYCSIGTEDLQTYYDFVCSLMTDTGFLIDTDFVKNLRVELQSRMEEPLAALIKGGFATVNKKGKVSVAEKSLKEYLSSTYPSLITYSEPSKTFPEGQVSLASESLQEFPSDIVLDALKEYKSCAKLLSTYVPNLLLGPVIHPGFNVLVESGRTSGHGHRVKDRPNRRPSENIQNLPKIGGIREAHIARPGNVLVSIDYSHIELDCLAQVTYELFGYSKMRDAINAGQDPHSQMGVQLLNLKEGGSLSYQEFIEGLKGSDKKYKQNRQNAKAANFGFPGGLGAARMVQYAKVSYGIKDMTLEKARELREVFLHTYPEVKELFCWYTMQEESDGWSYSSSGRWRAKCGYCSGLNGLGLQSRSADGAKVAGIRLAKACKLGSLKGCKLLGFCHDEYILEIPNDAKLEERIDIAMTEMLQGMAEILPDVKISLEASVMSNWTKDGPFLLEMSKSIEPRGLCRGK